MKVVDIHEVRDLLRDLDALRERVRRGGVKAWAMSVTDSRGKQEVHLGGTHKKDSAAALRASMAASWAMTNVERSEVQEQLTG